MVSIGKISGLNSLFPKIGQQQKQQTPAVSFGQNQSSGNSLQAKLSAIDNGNYAVAPTSAVNSSPTSFKSSSTNSNLQNRLNSIGTGELTPKYAEKKLDFMA